MTKKHLFDDIRQNPARIYRIPGDVLRDRRFSDVERLEILQTWRVAHQGSAIAQDIAALIAELERRIMASSHGHAAE